MSVLAADHTIITVICALEHHLVPDIVRKITPAYLFVKHHDNCARKYHIGLDAMYNIMVCNYFIINLGARCPDIFSAKCKEAIIALRIDPYSALFVIRSRGNGLILCVDYEGGSFPFIGISADQFGAIIQYLPDMKEDLETCSSGYSLNGYQFEYSDDGDMLELLCLGWITIRADNILLRGNYDIICADNGAETIISRDDAIEILISASHCDINIDNGVTIADIKQLRADIYALERM